jgi:hypothetical protein
VNLFCVRKQFLVYLLPYTLHNSLWKTISRPHIDSEAYRRVHLDWSLYQNAECTTHTR